MIFLHHKLRATIAVVLAGGLACPPARALVTLNEGRDRIYVQGSFGVSHDSNVFAANGSKGDFLYSSGMSAEYSRRAGWIGLNANVSVNAGRFGIIRGQDFSDPSLGVELTKQTGRTTGSVTLAAARESRADAALNTRASSWNYTYGMNARYHLTGGFDLSGNMNYSQRKYEADQVFSNLKNFSSGLDVFHVMSTERDVIMGYRYRYSDTSRNTSSTDHAFTAGLHGKIIRGIKGTLRLGYQVRIPGGRNSGAGNNQSWTGSGSMSYSISKKLSLSGQLSKDFSTTASDSSVDTMMASVDAQYAFSSHWSFSTSLAGGDSHFLGQGGRVILDFGPPLMYGPNRHDTYITWSASAGYSLNEHLKMGLTYSWFKNWSTTSFADFVRSSWNMNLSSRW